MTATLDQLCADVPLPGRRKLEHVHRERVVVGDLCMSALGLATSGDARDGGWITGSAAVLAGEPDVPAYFELVERLAVVDAIRDERRRYPLLDSAGGVVGEAAASEVFPESSSPTWAYSRSNGVAAHRTFAAAVAAAHRELVERDRVLRAWFGERVPARLHLPIPGARDLGSLYEVCAYSFSAPTDELAVAGVFAFPASADCPLVYGFGCAGDVEHALTRAADEAWQRSSFLWGEAIPNQAPAITPDALAHQEAFLWPGRHGLLRGWLHGEHARHRHEAPPRLTEREVRFADISPPELIGRVCVVRALHDAAVPLTFGAIHPRFPAAAPELAVHPIA